MLRRADGDVECQLELFAIDLLLRLGGLVEAAEAIDELVGLVREAFVGESRERSSALQGAVAGPEGGEVGVKLDALVAGAAGRLDAVAAADEQVGR